MSYFIAYKVLTVRKKYDQFLVLFFGKNLHVVGAFSRQILPGNQPLLTGLLKKNN